MKLIEDPLEVRRLCDAHRATGGRVGFVPTMGYLHDGHLALIRRARELADYVVVSIFVNPTQFAPGEDLERYPRDPAGDAAKCREAGVDVIFSPRVDTMYPPGHQTQVEVERVSQGLCGAARPHHFRGVCTVVAKLFNIVGPSVAVFGEKDYQQLQVIRRMVADLLLPVEVQGYPTIREPDGLAMSSRNAYLDAQHRRSAATLYRALCAVRDEVAGADVPAARAVQLARDIIERDGNIRIDYVELRHRDTLEPLLQARTGEAVLLVAAYLHQTRLIDNMLL